MPGVEGQIAERRAGPGGRRLDREESRHLVTPVALDSLAGHDRPVGQRVPAGRLYGADIEAQVGGAVLGRQEAVALHRHEPFD